MAAGGRGPCTAFVSGFKTNPVDAAFLNDHMIRAMDYNDIYWKADPVAIRRTSSPGRWRCGDAGDVGART